MECGKKKQTQVVKGEGTIGERVPNHYGGASAPLSCKKKVGNVAGFFQNREKGSPRRRIR